MTEGGGVTEGGRVNDARWRIGVDIGGTFADCVALAPDGSARRIKLLTDGRARTQATRRGDSVVLHAVPAWAAGALPGMRLTDAGGVVSVIRSATADGKCAAVVAECGDSAWFDLSTGEEAPVLAARLLTGTPPGATVPPLELRIGTTRGTNALLEGRVDGVAAFLDEGLEGLLAIGTQQRLGLFDLVPRLPPQLASASFGVRGRRAADGSVVVPFDEHHLRAQAREALRHGVRVAAVALLHAVRSPDDERRAARILREEGFERVIIGSDVASLPVLLTRAQTAAADGALTTAVHGVLARIGAALPGSRILAATSAGGTCSLAEYFPKDSLLSGPAMGCAAARAALVRAGLARAITFDMGGTSTDVARIEPAGVAMRATSTVAGITVAAASVDVHSVAAGGGSVCRATAEGIFVGPQSAGANPGPACYGRGGPLTVTDVNLLLGRLPERMQALPLDRAAAERAANREATVSGREREPMLRAMLALANEHMAGAVRAVTVVQGHDPRGFALAVFGGAGGQHGCAVADILGIEEMVVLPNAGFVSGHGALAAPVQRVVDVPVHAPLGDGAALRDAVAQAKGAALGGTWDGDGSPRVERITAVLHAPGQAGTIDIDVPAEDVAVDATVARTRFAERFAAMFGRLPPARDPVVETVRAVAASHPGEMDASLPARMAVTADGIELACTPGTSVPGPAIILETGATIVVDEGWTAEAEPSGILRMRRAGAPAAHAMPVDVVAARCTAIAAWMAAILERTARSVNVKDRLDFSCGVLGADGFLCANAPNVPVHLGALGACVRAILATRNIEPNEVVLTNHPAFGGSHLPDITVVRAVHDDAGQRIAFVAARAHHAEIGGIRPGSMPPDARNLAEEGVAIAPMTIARDGELLEDDLRRVLAAAPWPSRDPDLNVDDVRAAITAVDAGATALAELARTIGSDALAGAIDALLSRSASRTRTIAARVPVGGLARTERMDDGTPIAVRVDRTADGLRIDFAGSGGVHGGNLNAPLAVVRSAVLYSLRVLAGLDEPLDEHRAPLNEGFLSPVELRVPRGILNPDFAAGAEACPAVFAGNTETSQRVVDAVLGAFGVAAASQGTMNNLVIASDGFSIFETIGGGAGATADAGGTGPVHAHMTNTRLTDPETMERRSPARLERLQVRAGSGGAGAHAGGNGMVRRIRVLESCDACFAAQRRSNGPDGAVGGSAGACGEQHVLRADGTDQSMPGVFAVHLMPGDAIEIRTPGGGGWGAPRA